MTVPTQLFRWRYTATAAASTLYPYTNKILDEDWLKVYVEDVLQTISTHYTVTGVGLAIGGNVEFVTPPEEDEEILITKDGVQFTQELDYVENDAFPAEKHEDGLDKLTNIAQKIWDYVRRSVKLSITSEYTDMTLPDPEANKYLGWNAAGDALENLALVSLGAISDDAYNSGTWDGVDSVAPSKNAMRDKVELIIASILAKVSDTAYNSTTWNGVTTIAPSKNVVRDKFESLPDAPDTDTIEINILLLAFKIAVAESLTIFNMVDGVSDAFVDESGVDTGDSVDQDYDSGGDYYSPASSFVDATGSGVATASTELDAGFLASKAFDDTSDSCWLTSLSTPTGWLKYDLGDGNGVVATRYTVGRGTKTSSSANRQPKDWTFQGSNNDSDWDTLDTITSETSWGEDETRTFVFSNSTAYRYYKLDVTANNTDGDHVAVGELTIDVISFENMTLVSEATEAITQPDEIRIVIMEEDIDTITINTNFFGDVSRDDGGNWVEVVLEKAVDYASGKQILTGVGNVSGQAADKTIRCRTRSTDNDGYKIHNWSKAWK